MNMEKKAQKNLVKVFGMIAEKIGSDSFEVIDIKTIDEFRAYLIEQFPSLEDLKFSIALDREIVQAGGEIKEGAELALLPPFSGG